MATPTTAPPPRRIGGSTGNRLTAQKIGPLKVKVRDQGLELAGHWVYVFYRESASALKVAAEVHARDAQHWQVWMEPDMAKKNDQRRAAAAKTYPGYVPLAYRYAHAPHGYAFFISRVQITGEALKLVTAKVSALTWHTLNHSPDPQHVLTFDGVEMLRYTEHFYLNGYLPQLQRYLAWMSDQDRQGRFFIASVLDRWIGGPKGQDPLSIRKHLTTQPADWLKQYEKEERDLRVVVEKSMAYLVEHCIQKPEHRAQEWSMQAAGGAQVHLAMLHWAVIARTMTWTAPGRVFAVELLKDPHRVVNSHLFAEAPTFPQKPGPKDDPAEFATPEPNTFQLFRKGTTAALAVFTELVPARMEMIQRGVDLKSEQWKHRPKGALQREVKVYLENLGVETQLSKAQLTIQANLTRGERVTSGLVKGGKERKAILQEWEKLTLKLDAEGPADVRAMRAAMARLEKGQAKLEDLTKVDKWGGSALLAIEVVNLYFAIEELRQASPEAQSDKTLSLIGSSLDVAVSVTQVAQVYSQINKKLLSGMGGGLGLVSSLIDFRDASNEGFKAALMEGNPGKATGQGITAAGYSLGALSAGLMVAQAAGYGSAAGGPVGAVLGVVGAVLVIGGMVVVAWFTESDYQAFARRSFLGKEPGARAEAAWSAWGLGGPVGTQVAALYDLLYQPRVDFVVTARQIPTLKVGSFESEGTGFRLTIVPGLFEPGQTRYRVEVEVRDRDGKGVLLQESSLLLPTPQMQPEKLKDGTEAFVYRWPRGSIRMKTPQGMAGLRQDFHWYALPYRFSVQPLRENVPMGKAIEQKGRVGGKERSAFNTYHWNGVEWFDR